MTFQKFTAIAAAKRPDVRVHAHKAFGGVHDVAVIFIRDGKESKVYSYRGSYADILNRLGIKVITRADVATVEEQLQRAIANNGRQNVFTKKAMDTTDEIARLTAMLDAYNSDEYVRDWE